MVSVSANAGALTLSGGASINIVDTAVKPNNATHSQWVMV